MSLAVLARLLMVLSLHHAPLSHAQPQFQCRGFTYQRLHEAPSPNPNCYSGPGRVTGWV